MNRKEKVEKDSITFLAIIAIVLFLFMGLGTVLAQTSATTTVSNFKVGYASSNENIYGTWSSWDGSTVLYMDYQDEGDVFTRISELPEGQEVASGEFAIEEEFLYVQKQDDKYRLMFYLKGTQMIVMKPDSAGGPAKAWLFTKVSDYGLK
jgi:hypothetical protein